MRTFIVSFIACACLHSPARRSHAPGACLRGQLFLRRPIRPYRRRRRCARCWSAPPARAMRPMIQRSPVCWRQRRPTSSPTRPAGSNGRPRQWCSMPRHSSATSSLRGASVWAADRPVLLIVLTGGPASGAFETRRQVEGALDSASARRGLPITVARPEALDLPATGDIPAEAALGAAQRAACGSSAGRLRRRGTQRWYLALGTEHRRRQRNLERHARRGPCMGPPISSRATAVAYAAQPEMAILVEIEGVPTLKEFARVAEILGAATGVSSVQLAEAAGSRATFSVVTRGGADACCGSSGTNPHVRAHGSEVRAARSHFACVHS